MSSKNKGSKRKTKKSKISKTRSRLTRKKINSRIKGAGDITWETELPSIKDVEVNQVVYVKYQNIYFRVVCSDNSLGRSDNIFVKSLKIQTCISNECYSDDQIANCLKLTIHTLYQGKNQILTFGYLDNLTDEIRFKCKYNDQTEEVGKKYLSLSHQIFDHYQCWFTILEDQSKKKLGKCMESFSRQSILLSGMTWYERNGYIPFNIPLTQEITINWDLTKNTDIFQKNIFIYDEPIEGLKLDQNVLENTFYIQGVISYDKLLELILDQYENDQTDLNEYLKTKCRFLFGYLYALYIRRYHEYNIYKNYKLQDIQEIIIDIYGRAKDYRNCGSALFKNYENIIPSILNVYYIRINIDQINKLFSSDNLKIKQAYLSRLRTISMRSNNFKNNNLNMLKSKYLL